MYSRRSLESRGFVNFPVNDPQYKNSNEGGMFVRLVVTDDDWDNPFMVCCGGSSVVLYDESFLGDDTGDDLQSQSFHFPNLDSPTKNSDSPADRYAIDRYMSIAYLCTMTIGSTGWSGWNEEKSEYFRCSYEDLTPEGKDLYNMIKKLYEGKGTIYLQTWLDT